MDVTSAAVSWPISQPSSIEFRKWRPDQDRASTTSASESENEAYCRVVAVTVLDIENATSSVPK